MRKTRATALFISTVLLSTSQAFALQPLEVFTKGADHQPTLRGARATEEKADADRDVALGTLLPVFSARGVYTRNQYEASFQLPGTTTTLVIQPYNQLDAYLQLDVPLINVANWYRKRAANRGLEVATATRESTALDVEETIVRTYYQLIGAEALKQASLEIQKASEDNLKVVQGRVEVGSAPELDRQRAAANLERAKQDVADADLTLALTRRSLKTLSGVAPDVGAQFEEVATAEPEPLDNWMGRLKEHPSVRVARANKEVIEAQASAARATLIPVIAANGQERFTNATGFTGRSANYTLQAIATWSFDVGTLPRIRSQEWGMEAQAAREDLSRMQAEDRVYEAWHRIRAGIARVTAARAQASAAKRAKELSEDRYKAGAATQLDVVTAQRDFFQADVARIQAEADLSLGRKVLVLRVQNGVKGASDESIR